MRVAYLSLATPLNRASWSGMPWYSYREVIRRFDDVQLVDTPRLDATVERLAALQRYGLSVRQRRVFGRWYGATINHSLAAIKPDIVVAVGAMHKMTFVTDRYPVIHISDGLFATMVDYYERFGRFRQSVLREGHDDHQHVLDKTSMVLFASDWSRNSALALYDIDVACTRVVPFGANLDGEPQARPPQTDGPLRLLFVGYDWKRKGGDMVLATWRELRRLTGDAELHIVGCDPPAAQGLAGVNIYGRLDKARPADNATLARCYAEASVFFMPSRQEAFGMVFCEAAAYGIPAVATITGGIPTVVQNNVTGLLHPLGSPPEVVAASILELWNDKPRYLRMSQAARHRYETVLNWRAWGDGLESAIDDVLAAAG